MVLILIIEKNNVEDQLNTALDDFFSEQKFQEMIEGLTHFINPSSSRLTLKSSQVIH